MGGFGGEVREAEESERQFEIKREIRERQERTTHDGVYTR
jgi:hypothetical protein